MLATQLSCRPAVRCGGASHRKSVVACALKPAAHAAAPASRSALWRPRAVIAAVAQPQHGRSRALGVCSAAAAAEVSPARLRQALIAGTASDFARCSPQQAPAPELSGGLSEDEAVANIIKAVMGAGVFSLPWAVAQGGIVFVPAFIMAAAALALHTLSMLVAAKRKILQLRPDAAAQARRCRGFAARRHAYAAASCVRCRATPASWRPRWARSVAAPQRRAFAITRLDAASLLTLLRVSACR